MGLLLRVSQGCSKGVTWCMVSSEALLGKVLLPGSLRIQFLVLIGLRALALCWLSARGCPQQLEATQSSLPHGVPQYHQSMQAKKAVAFTSKKSVTIGHLDGSVS